MAFYCKVKIFVQFGYQDATTYLQDVFVKNIYFQQNAFWVEYKPFQR